MQLTQYSQRLEVTNMAAHLSSGDAANRSALRDEDGGRAGWVRRLQQQANKGSPAHYYNTVHYRDNSSRETLERGRQRYAEDVARAVARKKKAEEMRPEEGESSGSDDGADFQPLVGGATAREWGLRPRAGDSEIDSPSMQYDWAWLDNLD